MVCTIHTLPSILGQKKTIQGQALSCKLSRITVIAVFVTSTKGLSYCCVDVFNIVLKQEQKLQSELDNAAAFILVR